ncbi:uncharacterized protein LOC141699810 [Apium graveolens]|uniref:uncharacterized protein LOC141699810 n=1 Tax=Apium graveolens TaxID=4045 RepID=UPI003D7B5B7C
MLGNQVWRFLTKPNSLVSKVYKARYFLNENYLDSSAGHNPSFVWRSIWKAGDVVKAGVHWVVGSGEMINIGTTMGGDDEILKDLFNDRDQDCIRSVPLNEDMRQYRIYWSKESSGEYSVRSAYRLLQVQKALWRQEDNDSFWRKIWKIRALPKLVDGDGDSSWVKPHESIIKVSVDATTFREYSGSGMGVIVIDAGELAEALAIKEALSWIKNQGWQGVIVESDFLVAVQAIRSKAPMVSPFGRVIEACRAMLRDLNTVSLFFIKRSANVAAHELARVSYSIPDRVFDWSFVPIGAFNALKADLLS